MKSALLAFISTAGLTLAGTAPAPAPVGKGPAPVVPQSDCPPLSYTFVEAGYRHADSSSMTSDGGYVDLSAGINDWLSVDLDASYTAGDFDQTNVAGGVGFRAPLSDRFHFVLRGGYYFFDQETDDGSYDENGFYVAPGFRAQLTCNLELFGKLFVSLPVDNSTDEDSDDTYLTAEGGLVYSINEQLGLVAAFGHDLENDDSWSVRAGIRYNF